ncbi:hypothetical protein CONLIGDRAFT_633151 [Coniochaeta ligniaria NRRL 30616]|uniref:Uncharacterized protein n=1 Tax=Coniochaeta ligniaria NRRL 30616 TaxID=1408157 RepID=A0A1J7IMY6_9PEZI|nr:hypothetical protein CONLIGDRAFT_633151 [Coniochaeta ligniaria NRRL 30616]
MATQARHLREMGTNSRVPIDSTTSINRPNQPLQSSIHKTCHAIDSTTSANRVEPVANTTTLAKQPRDSLQSNNLKNH